MFYFMSLTGVRVGEIGGVKWSDVDFRKNAEENANLRNSITMNIQKYCFFSVIDKCSMLK